MGSCPRAGVGGMVGHGVVVWGGGSLDLDTSCRLARGGGGIVEIG
jgi:hypothetical protein